MRLKNWLVFSCALVALADRVAAGEKICAEDDPRKCSQAVEKGEFAPFAGQLLTPTLAAELGVKADSCDARLDLEVNFQRKLVSIPLELERTLRKQEQEAFAQERALLLKRLEEATSRPWYERPLFVATVTALLVIGVSFAWRKY